MSSKTKTAVPKLRFPEFRDAGEWGSKEFRELYSFIGTNSLSRDKLSSNSGAVKNIHYGDIHTKFPSHFDVGNEDVPYIVESESLEKIKPESYCEVGDLVFADASEDIDDIGKCIEIVELGNEKVLSGLHTILARPNEAHLVPGLAGHLFQSSRIRRQIQKEAQGAKVLGISKGRLERIVVCFPESEKEQQKIADCLTSLDELIAAEGQNLEALRDHKKGLMQNLFPAEGQTLPKFRFPEFRDAGEWTKETLGQKVSKVGSGVTPRGGAENYKERGRPFVRSQNVGWGTLLLDDVAFIDEETHASFPATELQENDVLLNITGASIGRSALADSSLVGGNVNQHVCIIRPKVEEIRPAFLCQILISEYGQKMIDECQAGGNRQGLNFNQIRSFKLLLPKVSEQQKIANCLSSLDDLITAQSQKIEALRDHKKGLLQQLFPSAEEVA